MSVHTEFIEMPAGAYEPGLRLIHGDAAPSIPEKIKTGLSSLWAWVTDHAAKSWNWVKETLHLQGAIDWTKNAAATTWATIRSVGTALGTGGTAGAGLLVVSTSPGRKVLHYLVGVPAKFVAKWFGRGWHAVANFHADHLGTYGNWVADRMQDVEQWAFGKDGVHGVVGKVTGFYMRHVAKHMSLNSVVMRTTRLLGTMLFGVAMLNVFPLFLAGTALAVAVYVTAGVTIVASGWQGYFLGRTIGSIPAVAQWLNDTRSSSDQAAKVATSTVNGVNIATLVEDMAASTKEEAPHRSNVRAHNPNVRATK